MHEIFVSQSRPILAGNEISYIASCIRPRVVFNKALTQRTVRWSLSLDLIRGNSYCTIWCFYFCGNVVTVAVLS
jgi:hypothetical protein